MKALHHLVWRKRRLRAVLARVFVEARLATSFVVWAFALIGVVSVVRSMVRTDSMDPGSRLPRRSVELGMAEILGLPEYPGARRSEYRAEVFGDERVTEIEYIVDSSVPEVRDYYRDVFARGDWTVTDTTWVRGEWVYAVSRGDRSGFVEIEHRDGIVEIEVEMAEPAVPQPGSPVR